MRAASRKHHGVWGNGEKSVILIESFGGPRLGNVMWGVLRVVLEYVGGSVSIYHEKVIVSELVESCLVEGMREGRGGRKRSGNFLNGKKIGMIGNDID